MATIDGQLMIRPNCHSARVWNLLAGRAICSRFSSKPRAHEVEESLFVLGSKEGGILRRFAPQNDRLGKVWRLAATIIAAAALVFAAGSVWAQAPTQGADRVHELGKQIMCTCGCGDTAGSCSHPGAAFSGPCEVAKAKLKEVNERIGRGESDSGILQALVKEYGEAVLAAPPASGFLNRFAYIFPAIAFTIGLALVIMISRRWRRRRIALAHAAGPAISNELLEHARRQIERDVQDD
jgi:cytochrome c-type biogenesis protein CcmH/NrfF